MTQKETSTHLAITHFSNTAKTPYVSISSIIPPSTLKLHQLFYTKLIRIFLTFFNNSKTHVYKSNYHIIITVAAVVYMLLMKNISLLGIMMDMYMFGGVVSTIMAGCLMEGLLG